MNLPKEAVPGSARHVLMVLAWHCNELAVRKGNRRCYPSLNTLSAETSLDRTTCMRAVDLLEERRLMDVERRPRIANRYTLTDPVTWQVRDPPKCGTARVAQPDAGRVAPPEAVRDALRQFIRQVAPQHHAGRVGPLQQELQNSEQRDVNQNLKAGRRDTPRSREEQLAYVHQVANGETR
jgi:hypothetical protein